MLHAKIFIMEVIGAGQDRNRGTMFLIIWNTLEEDTIKTNKSEFQWQIKEREDIKMKEFRVAKCLGNDGVQEYAIFADGSRKKRIYIDEQYGKYFEVDNELNTDCKTCLKYSFSGRIKDAIDTIKSGNGDCIKQINFFGKHGKVLYFIDRKVGEELRQKSLEGWKDTKFAWAVECGNKNSFSGYAPINLKGERISMFDEERTVKTFDTKDKAEEYVKGLLEKAAFYAKRLANRYHEAEEDEKENVIDQTIKDINEFAGTQFSVLSDFVFDMLTGDCELKSFECTLDEYGYKIIQCIA